jgi:zinc and cadmium transporter
MHALGGWFALYALLLVLSSLAGGYLPSLVKLTHRRLQLATSAIGGFMLGVALLILLPHALMGADVEPVMLWMLAGLLVMFFLERFLAHHHHTAPGDHDLPPVTADPEPVDHCSAAPGSPLDHTHGHQHHDHAHDHAHDHPHEHHADRAPKLAWLGAASGMVLHSLLDGASLAAAMSLEAALHGQDAAASHTALPALAVLLVVILHKPFDAMALLTLMHTAGYARATQWLVNLLFALVAPLGGLLFLVGIGQLDAHSSAVVAAALAFSAGVFLCIALADLLPEVHFHRHDRGKLSLALLLGLALAWTIHAIEARSHAHQHGHGLIHDEHDEHDDHDH